MQTPWLITAMKMDAGEKCASRRLLCQLRQAVGEDLRSVERRHGDQHLPFADGENVFEGQMTFTFLAFEIAFGQQTAKPPIGLARGGIGDDFETIPGDKPRSDEEPDRSLLCFIISPHDAGKAVAVGNADGGKTE